MVLKLTADRILITTIVMLLAAVAVIIFISISHTKQVNAASKMVDHTQEVIISAEKVLSLAIANETASRGFAVTGRPGFLHTINETKGEAYLEFQNLKVLAKGNNEQQVRLDSLLQYLGKRLVFSDSNVIVYNKSGSSAALARMGTGEIYSDKIKNIISNIQRTENILLTQLKDINTKKTAEQSGIYFSIIITILLLLGVFIQKVRLELKEKKKLTEELASLNTQLEKKVVERTAELTSTSKKLQDTFFAYQRCLCCTG